MITRSARHDERWPVSDVDASAPGGRRSSAARGILPSGRAVVGGFLVALAALGSYTAATAGQRSLPTYVVASTTLRVGQRLTAGDLRAEPMRLPAVLADRLAFRSAEVLVGAVVVAPVTAGELMQASDVVRAAGAPGEREISFPVDPARALNGALSPGDRVDVVATFGTSVSATTKVVLRGALVVSLATASSAIAGSGSEVVTLDLASSRAIVALAQAVDSGQIFLVRSTGAAAGSVGRAGGAA